MSKETEALIITGDDWEALFIDGKKVEEGHNLHDGIDRIVYIRKASRKYKFDIFKLKFGFTTDNYESYLYNVGDFHDDLSEIDYDPMEEPN